VAPDHQRLRAGSSPGAGGRRWRGASRLTPTRSLVGEDCERDLLGVRLAPESEWAPRPRKFAHRINRRQTDVTSRLTEGFLEALQEFVDNFTYLGVFAVLVLGSLGVPIPEEMPIIAAAVLSHEGVVRWWLALPVCLLGVLSGDMVLYWVGRHWGEQLLNWRLVRLVLSPAREQWLKAAYRRHALKTIVTARHVMGFRAAAFLTAGSAGVPFWKFVVADAGAAVIGVPLAFGLAYFFTDQIKAIMADVHRAERWLGLAGLLAFAAVLVVGVWRWHRRLEKERRDAEASEQHSPP
jgi:membrane protein DedA with SNARE-associated domain